MLFIVQVLVVHGTLCINGYLLFGLVQGFTQLIDAPVIISIFQRTGGIFIDAYIIRYVAQLIVIFITETSGRRNLRMNIICTVFHSFPKSFYIVTFQSFHIGISHYRSGIVTYHTAPVPGTCPFGKESAFLVSICQSLLHLFVHRRIHQVEEREQAAECIPETGIGKHISRQHFTVVGTVMYRFPFGIQFVEASREKYRTIEARVECTEMIGIIVFHLNTSQNLVPFLASFGCNSFQIVFTQLFQVLFCLLGADKRRSHSYVDRLSTTCREPDDTTCMFIFRFQLTRTDVAVGNCCGKSERLIEHQYKIILKVLRHSSTVLSCVADDLVLFRNHFHIRTVVESIYHYIRVFTLRKSETKHRRTAGRSNFGRDIMIGQIYFIIIRFGNLSFMREPARTLILIEHDLSRNRHNGKLPVVINPRAGLVSLLKSPDFIGIIGISPSITHLSGLCHPEVHSPRHGNSRICISGR